VKLFTHGAPVAVRRSVADRRQIAIRQADGGDLPALEALAALTEHTAPALPALLAEADGVLVAALSRRSGDLVTDPFVATGDVVALLRLRSAQLDAAA
jgi:hypothetical protein